VDIPGRRRIDSRDRSFSGCASWRGGSLPPDLAFLGDKA
jgi:hypothetical protein